MEVSEQENREKIPPPLTHTEATHWGSDLRCQRAQGGLTDMSMSPTSVTPITTVPT